MASMLSVFLLQLAGGCMLCIGLTRIDDMSWKYLRLVAIVSLAGLVTAGITIFKESDGWPIYGSIEIRWIVWLAWALGVFWIFGNALQGARIQRTQRVWPILGGLAALTGANVIQGMGIFRYAWDFRAGVAEMLMWTSTISLVIGSLLIGSVTACMLLGHRYLTDTGMTIAPLRRLATSFVSTIWLRAIWVAAMLIWYRDRLHYEEPREMWTMLLIGVRVGIGIVGTAVFAYMVWDCVKRRSTQSATGILYLTMVFVFIGELTGQYLLRAAGLPV